VERSVAGVAVAADWGRFVMPAHDTQPLARGEPAALPYHLRLIFSGCGGPASYPSRLEAELKAREEMRRQQRTAWPVNDLARGLAAAEAIAG
jgi:hypothetical protein